MYLTYFSFSFIDQLLIGFKISNHVVCKGRAP